MQNRTPIFKNYRLESKKKKPLSRRVNYALIAAILIKSIQLLFQLLKAFKCALQILYNIIRKHIGIGEIIKIRERLVFNPKDIKACLIALQKLVYAKFTPTSIGILLRPRFLTLVAIFGIIARYEILQIRITHRVLLQGEVDIGTEIINPNILSLSIQMVTLVLAGYTVT